MKQKHKILIVDDEEDLCEILQFNLESEGYDTMTAYSAEEALKLDLSSFSLILLDVMMEQISGFKFAGKIRKEMNLDVPIIFITAKNTENDLLTGFSLGGDDYITKPFSVQEVKARVKALLKRIASEKVEELSNFEFEDMVLSFDKKNLVIDNKEIQLTRKEFKILALLMKHKGRIISRDEIMNEVWDDDTVVSSRTIDVHVARIRKKAGRYGACIKGRQGFGYTFETR